jgi:hypothetical protein
VSTQAPRAGGRECPVLEGTPDHCKATVRPGHLMCARHWAQVPVDVRSTVWSRWRAWQRASTDDRWDQYMEARASALQHFVDEHDRYRGTPSMSLTLEDLDAAALVLVVAVDGTSRLWSGGDHAKAAHVLQTVWADLGTGPVVDGRPT